MSFCNELNYSNYVNKKIIFKNANPFHDNKCVLLKESRNIYIGIIKVPTDFYSVLHILLIYCYFKFVLKYYIKIIHAF